MRFFWSTVFLSAYKTEKLVFSFLSKYMKNLFLMEGQDVRKKKDLE